MIPPAGCGTDSTRAEVVAIAQVVALTVTGALPAFLTSALAVQVRGDFGIGPAAFGLATAVLFAISAVCSPVTGRLIGRRGTRFGYVAASGVCALSLLIIAAAPGFAALIVALAVGGVANALAQPTANLLLSQRVSPRRLGIAMGLKQSYIPVASILGGLSIPAVALHFGWRWSVVVGALLAVAVLIWGCARVRADRPLHASMVGASLGRGQEIARRSLAVLTVGAGAGASASTAMGVFLVDSGVDAGSSAAGAGYLLALCSILSFAGRVGFGWAVDRLHSRKLFLLVANLMLVSAAGFLLLAMSDPHLFITGAIIGYLGWSWTGIFHLAVVTGSKGNVAAATGVIQSGLALGAAIGPLSFGAAAQWASYQVAWIGTAVVGVFGVIVVRSGARMLRRDELATEDDKVNLVRD